MNKVVAFISAIPLILNLSCQKENASSLSIETNIEDNSKLSLGRAFDLKIEATDRDNIESVKIDIESINYHELYTAINKSTWKFDQTLTIDTVLSTGKSFVNVLLIDKTGEEASSSLTIEIQ